MSLDRNPKTVARLRRNAQRLRDGGATSDILINAPLALSAGRIGLTLGAATGLQVQSSALGIKLASSPGLSMSASGLTVSLNATNPALSLTSGLGVTVSGTSLTKDSSGLLVNLATSSGLEIVSGLKAKVDGSTVTINGSGQLVAAGGVSTAGFRNKVLNGDFRVAQRGTSFVIGATTNTYTLDRWVGENQTAGVLTVTQDTDVPTGKHGFSLKARVSTADASIGAGEYMLVQQKIEGYDIADVAKASGNFRLSFWAKASGSATIPLSLRNAGADQSYVSTIALTTTWTQFSYTIPMTTSGTWDYTTGVGLYLAFVIGAGSSFSAGFTNSWIAANNLTASGIFAQFDNLNFSLFLWGVELEPGTSTTGFEPRPYALEELLCKRYYEKMNGNMVVNATNIFHNYAFKAAKRVAPTVTATFTGGTGATFSIGTDGFYQNANHTVDSAFTAVANAEL